MLYNVSSLRACWNAALGNCRLCTLHPTQMVSFTSLLSLEPSPSACFTGLAYTCTDTSQSAGSPVSLMATYLDVHDGRHGETAGTVHTLLHNSACYSCWFSYAADATWSAAPCVLYRKFDRYLSPHSAKSTR